MLPHSGTPHRRLLWLTIVVVGLLAGIWFTTDNGRHTMRSLFPNTFIAWEEETAYLRCVDAINGQTPWPKTDKYRCRAMHMCAEKADLSAEQRASLQEAILAIPHCQPL